MKLGKTYQAIAIADFYKEDWPLLIVTTATARETWEKHIQDLLPWVSVYSIQLLASSHDYVGDCKVLITSYSLMDKNVDILTERGFGCVILVRFFNQIKHFKCLQMQTNFFFNS